MCCGSVWVIQSSNSLWIYYKGECFTDFDSLSSIEKTSYILNFIRASTFNSLSERTIFHSFLKFKTCVILSFTIFVQLRLPCSQEWHREVKY